MLAQVLKLRTIVVPVLLCAFVVALTSCASQKETALVSDPDDHGGSSDAMEQTGTMGNRRAVPGHDRPPLDPIFGSGSTELRLACAVFGLTFR